MDPNEFKQLELIWGSKIGDALSSNILSTERALPMNSPKPQFICCRHSIFTGFLLLADFLKRTANVGKNFVTTPCGHIVRK